MFTENEDTQIFRVVVRATVSEGRDYWSKVYGPYPKKTTRNGQLTRIKRELDGVILRHKIRGKGGLESYEIWPEEGTISWRRDDD